jgi:hypothetical protein
MRLRRKSAETPADAGPETGPGTGPENASDDAKNGPFDISEVDPDATYIDLGSLLVQPAEGLDLRLQVDEQSGTVMTVLLVADEGVLEMRAFASARGGDLWSDARREIAADTARRGGTATEQEGAFGVELLCQVPVTGPHGESLMQPSRVIGHTGPRWFLRATMAGRPVQDSDYAAPFEQALRNVAVRRGSEAMAPGEALPLRMPPQASRLDEPDGSGLDPAQQPPAE